MENEHPSPRIDVLLLGGGGREHALAQALAGSPRLGRLMAAPGNPGVAALAECVALDPLDAAAVARFALDRRIGLVVVGPEAPLEAGVSDALAAAGVACFGPSRAAAMLETSKAFTKEICAACGAPTARAAVFDDLEAARAHVRAAGAPIVVKADGLAAGKGVVVAETEAEALEALDAMAEGLGRAAARVVLEEKMTGVEASLFALVDGARARFFGSAADHKRAHDGDLGPNTGGMGALSPAPALTPEIEARAMAEIVAPVVAEMARRGTPYRGVLYAGLMIEAGRPRLVEFNARFGDPETQALLARLRSDLLPALLACATGRGLEAIALDFAPEPALTVVMAARGYPGAYGRGEPIHGLDAAAATEGVRLHHAGTARDAAGRVVSAGGRVLGVTATGADVDTARARAYAAIERIDWPGGFCRRDIGLQRG